MRSKDLIAWSATGHEAPAAAASLIGTLIVSGRAIGMALSIADPIRPASILS